MPYTDTEHKAKVRPCWGPKQTLGTADSGGMREFSGKRGLRRLGVLIGQADTARGVDQRMFLVVGPDDRPRVPQDMIETQQIRVLR
jgi:hypothetical protein